MILWQPPRFPISMLKSKKQFNAFSDAVKADDAELAKETADALVEMVERRNQKCKLLK